MCRPDYTWIFWHFVRWPSEVVRSLNCFKLSSKHRSKNRKKSSTDISSLRFACIMENMLNPILHGGGVKSTPPGWLLYANPRGMPRMDWFFMTLFLSILERSWVGHFWDFFLKFPKNFTSTIFSIYNPKGGPFYASVRTPFARNFFVLFWVKNGNNSTSNALIMGNNNQFLPKHAFLPSLNHFSSF